MVQLANWGEFLGSRSVGTHIRHDIERVLEASDTVVIDFAGVDMVTHSFADECIGKLAVGLGQTEFVRRVRLRNVESDIAPILRYVLASRLPRPES